MHSNTIIALTMLLPLMFSSCRKELVYPSQMDAVKVDFDWQNDTLANPEGMVVLFYPVDGGKPWRFDYSQMGGGTAILPSGEYRIVTHNNDTDGVLYVDTNDFWNYSVTTMPTSLFAGLDLYYSKTGAPSSRTGSEQPVVVQPDIMWSDVVSDPPFNTSTGAITLYPRRIVTIVRYNVTDIKNLDQAAMMSAAVTGMAESIDFATGKCTDRIVTIPGDLMMDTPTTAHGYITAFLNRHDEHHQHNLQLYFWLTDGKQCFFDIDVTKQFNDAPDPLNITINVSGIELPMSSGGSSGNTGGLGVGVDGWDRVDIELSN